jgi:polyhydroxybutyrate depolymerase
VLAAGACAAWATIGIASPARATAQAGPCQQAPPAGDSHITLVSGGLRRTALLHVPPAPAGRGLPLLVGLHGAGGGFFARYTGFSQIADGEGFVAVYPDASQIAGRGFWNINDRDPASPDDVRFISDLLDLVQGTLCIDPARVYAAGVSNGGGMAARLACQLSGRFAAIVSIAGGYGSQPPCQPQNPVSVMEIHGTSDGSVPYGGSAGGIGAVRPWLNAWARRDACRGVPKVSRAAARVMRYRWSKCAEGTTVEHLEIRGGAHQLPGGLPRDPGPVSTILAPWLAWSFLRGHRQAPPLAVPVA